MATHAIPALMIDGTLIDRDGGPRPALDDGLVRGDGVFEGLRTYARRPRTPEAHLDRLARSAQVVDLPIDRGRLREELERFCAATGEPDCGVRLMVTRGGQVIWREEALPQPPADGLRLRPTPHRVTPLLIGAKTLSYAPNMQAARLARAAGCHDALLVRADDEAVLEGPTTAFGWLEGDTLVFPPIADGVLDSITRRLAVAAVPTRERTATLDELAEADGAFLMSTLLEAVPVAEVLDVARYDIGARRTREVAEAVAAACAAAA